MHLLARGRGRNSRRKRDVCPWEKDKVGLSGSLNNGLGVGSSQKVSWFIDDGWTLGLSITSKDNSSGLYYQGVNNGCTHLHNGNISGVHDKQKLRSPSSIIEYCMSFPNSSCPGRITQKSPRLHVLSH